MTRNSGVGISIEFQAAYRHTDHSFLYRFPELIREKWSSIREIATPVCALARNDMKFDTVPASPGNSNLLFPLESNTRLIHFCQAFSFSASSASFWYSGKTEYMGATSSFFSFRAT